MSEGDILKEKGSVLLFFRLLRQLFRNFIYLCNLNYLKKYG